MRVGIDAHSLGSGSAGNEAYFEQLLQYLAKAAANGSEYVVYYTHPDGARRVPPSEKLQLKRIRPATPIWRIPVGFPLEFRREKLDVFHAQHIIPPFCTCKTVTTIPDIAYEHFPEFYSRFVSGHLKHLIADDGLSGVTSNPSIFEKAIAGSTDYDGAIRKLASEGRGAAQLFETLAVEDIQMAAACSCPLTTRRMPGMAT